MPWLPLVPEPKTTLLADKAPLTTTNRLYNNASYNQSKHTSTMDAFYGASEHRQSLQTISFLPKVFFLFLRGRLNLRGTAARLGQGINNTIERRQGQGDTHTHTHTHQETTNQKKRRTFGGRRSYVYMYVSLDDQKRGDRSGWISEKKGYFSAPQQFSQTAGCRCVTPRGTRPKSEKLTILVHTDQRTFVAPRK